MSHLSVYVDTVDLIKKITRKIRLNALSIFYPNISYSQVTKLPVLVSASKAGLLQIKIVCNQRVKRGHQKNRDDKIPTTVAFSDYSLLYLSFFFCLFLFSMLV